MGATGAEEETVDPPAMHDVVLSLLHLAASLGLVSRALESLDEGEEEESLVVSARTTDLLVVVMDLLRLLVLSTTTSPLRPPSISPSSSATSPAAAALVASPSIPNGSRRRRSSSGDGFVGQQEGQQSRAADRGLYWALWTVSHAWPPRSGCSGTTAAYVV